MDRQTSQTETIATSSSKNEGILDRITQILSPFKSDRWLAAVIYGGIAAIGVSIGTLAWNWSDLQTNPSDQAKQRFDASLSIISTGATIAAGGVLYLNFTIAQEKLRQEKEKARQDTELAEARLVSERFSKAVEMLGNDKSIHVRLGGIYALESIANDSNPEAPDEIYRQVLEVLTAFVRENASYPPKKKNMPESVMPSDALEPAAFDANPEMPNENYRQVLEILTAFVQENSFYFSKEKNESEVGMSSAPSEPAALENAVAKEEEVFPLRTDIQAISTILRRRKHGDQDWKQYSLDLRKTDLRRTHLKGANLQKADLKEAVLQEADLKEAVLQGADLAKANLQEADLKKANLQEADLKKANLQEADLKKANLQGAKFWASYLRDTELAEAKEQARVNIQSARNWETAQYDPEIREWLGLPLETIQSKEETS